MSEDLRTKMMDSRVTKAVIWVLPIVIGALVSAYFYYKSIKIGTIYYQVQQVQVFDQTTLTDKLSNSGGPLYVVDEHGHRINDSIFAANVKVWNGGNDEVRKDDVRVPFAIKIMGEARLVNATMFYATSDNVDDFTLNDLAVLNWKYFDAGDGFAARIIYTAKKQYPIVLTGRAAGSSGPIDASISRKRSENVFVYAAFLSGATLAIGVFCVLLLRIWRESKGDAEDFFVKVATLSRISIMVIASILTYISLFSLVVWFIAKTGLWSAVPPF